MTAPTRALTPIVLTDFWRLQVERRGVSEAALFSRAEIETSVRRAHCMQLHEEVRINARVSVQAHYAGHVLGAVMFLIRIDAPPEPLVPSASPPSAYPGGSNHSSAPPSSYHRDLAPYHHRSIAVASSPSLARAPLFILYSGDIHHAAAAHLGAFSLARLPPPLSGAFGAALGMPSVGALGRASATAAASAAKKSAAVAGSGGLGGLADALRPPAQNPALHSPHALSVLITESTCEFCCCDHNLLISSRCNF